MECKVLWCLASSLCLITMWVKHSWYTRSVQYLISQQRLHDGTDARTLYAPRESKTHTRGATKYSDSDLCTSWELFGLVTCMYGAVGRKGCWNVKVRRCSSHVLNTSAVYVQGCWTLTRGATLVMRQGCPLPLCHVSSENLTWHVYIGFLHLPF